MICKFYGGPQHGEVLAYEDFRTEIHFRILEPLPVARFYSDYPKISRFKTAIYKNAWGDSTIFVNPRPFRPEVVYRFVFSGVEE